MNYFVAIMRINQSDDSKTNSQEMSASMLGRWAEVNIKLIRNAVVVTAIIVVISMMGKASAHDYESLVTVNDYYAGWMMANYR